MAVLILLSEIYEVVQVNLPVLEIVSTVQSGTMVTLL